jgi:hypothetical protein
MTNEVAESNLQKWFWIFKEKMVDEFPEYHGTFDYVVSTSDALGVLYEVMEFSYRHLEMDADERGGMNNLTISDYLKAIDYGYMAWEERWWAI